VGLPADVVTGQRLKATGMQRREKTYLWIIALCFGYGGLILISPNAAGAVVFYGAFLAACAVVLIACYYAYRFVYIVDRDRLKRAAELAELAEMIQAQRARRRSTEQSRPGSRD